MISKKMGLKLSFFGILALAFLMTAFPLQAQETKGHQPGGTIKGVVNTPWVKRYPALVYVDQVKGEFPPPLFFYLLQPAARRCRRTMSASIPRAAMRPLPITRVV